MLALGMLLSLIWAALESGGINHCRVRMISQGQRELEIQEWQINRDIFIGVWCIKL